MNEERIRELEREAWIWKRAFEMAVVACINGSCGECAYHSSCAAITSSDCVNGLTNGIPKQAEAEWEEQHGNQPGEK